MSNRKKNAVTAAKKAEVKMEKTEVPSLQETAEKAVQAANSAQHSIKLNGLL